MQVPCRSKMEVYVSIINSQKRRLKNVRDANHSPVTIKAHGPMPMGFVGQKTVKKL